MWIRGTLGLQSIAQTSTNKQVFRMIQVDQYFNEPVPYSSRTTALYNAAKEKYHEHTPVPFAIPEQKLFFLRFYFAEPIFAEGRKPKINSFFCIFPLR